MCVTKVGEEGGERIRIHKAVVAALRNVEQVDPYTPRPKLSEILDARKTARRKKDIPCPLKRSRLQSTATLENTLSASNYGNERHISRLDPSGIATRMAATPTFQGST